MHSLSHFRPTLYVLLALGISGFAIASESPGIWVVGMTGLFLNGWLFRTGRYRPLPRLAANVLTLASLGFVVQQFMTPAAVAVLVIGEFLVILQLVKLWELRANRDYAQLLVLSLLLMVAGAINATSLFYGILLILYLFLSLYTCLLFHLKVATDHAREAATLPESKVSATVIRQDRRQLSRSLRRISGGLAGGAILMAGFVFLFFPRSSTPMFLNIVASQSLTGFTETVNLGNTLSIQENDQEVMHLKVERNGTSLGNGSSIYLRGVTMDHYAGLATEAVTAARDLPSKKKGAFTRDVGVERGAVQSLASGFPANLYEHRQGLPIPPARREPSIVYRQMVQLLPTGTRVLFSVAGDGFIDGQLVALPSVLTPTKDIDVVIGEDGAIQSHDRLPRRLDYEVASSNDSSRTLSRLRDDPRVLISGSPDESWRVDHGFTSPPFLHFFGVRNSDVIKQIDGRTVGDTQGSSGQSTKAVREAMLAGKTVKVQRGEYEAVVPYVASEIDAYARRPDVSGVDEQGQPLANQRNRLSPPGPLDAMIASNIAAHLRNSFTYTLDLTDAVDRRKQDPIIWFLSENGRRGHCEYFASAMTLLCQSLGLNARVAVGFRTDEFNPFNEEFIIRQLHAHTWVEVLTPEGWRMYDPTSSRTVDGEANNSSLWTKLKHLLNWAEFVYAQNVIAYDNEQRQGLLQTVESEMTKPLYEGVNRDWITSRFTDSKLYKLFAEYVSGFLRVLIVVVGAFIGLVIVRSIYKQWRLRQRAARIGLTGLPDADQLKLAEQLKFYDDLLQLLARRQIVREPHLTPMEFARSLLFLPTTPYETITKLTNIFYRVRYGRQPLPTDAAARLARVITQLDVELGPVPATRPTLG